MVVPEFIVPPPGLIPDAPQPTTPDPALRPARADERTDSTVRALPGRALPTFTPVPNGPPAASVAVPESLRPAPAEAPAANALFELVSAAGETVELAGRVIVGRNPSADVTRPDARPIALVDPTRTVSKTHALVEVRQGRVVITDLHSTNGVAVQAAGGEPTVLDPGAPADVEPGSTLRLGDLALTLRRTTATTV
ncbi:FHA domain-containing protein [Agromyces sp. CF514]|uniref:FHA domain-containing protein n=1 Tax=Agromyces sp. CF514 TaxID=1881031 RepID=UPI0008E9A611|nr:FHA domain-containing protein [Agromyces sp. CF514]SFR75268.1 FHA domain-containing protein [Agromyces sp. CF514]